MEALGSGPRASAHCPLAFGGTESLANPSRPLPRFPLNAHRHSARQCPARRHSRVPAFLASKAILVGKPCVRAGLRVGELGAVLLNLAGVECVAQRFVVC